MKGQIKVLVVDDYLTECSRLFLQSVRDDSQLLYEDLLSTVVKLKMRNSWS
jgi:hypothetical protein